MGKWNDRLPRRTFRHQKPWTPPHVTYDSKPIIDNVPAWEKKFCYKIGSVPWRKIVNTKDFMSYYTNVVDWNDSAVKEAFDNAKKRFWAELNGFDCDIPMPDPDSYIDEVDWNPVIDSELMKELERTFFNPDDVRQENENQCKKEDMKSKSSTSAPDGGNVNPWESNNAETSKEDGWNQWKNNSAGVPMNIDGNEKSWQSNITEKDTKKENSWGDQAKKSWGQDLMEIQSSNQNENPWDRGNQGFASSSQNSGWGSWNKVWGLNKHESSNMGNNDDPWVCSSSQYGWQHKGRETTGRKHWNPYSTQNKGFGIRRSGNSRQVWNEDFSNRVGGYRNSRFGGEEAQTSWRGNNKTRVTTYTCGQ
ncbi:uncharacterized protein LOC115710019 [Cannabis sativa]|uniref:uncharacterized protein LOC115710019 n=1 Tax=Cannabis sativa TaxID=3483 RepID=UPI0029C9E05D|nr:uncharacterized protein LOC115710019 [Cannabis sativa]